MSGSYLKQATAGQARAIGPFLAVETQTPQTGLTIANTDIKLVSNGAASTNKNSGGGTHRVNGEYGVTFDATDTANVGELKVSVLISGSYLVFHTYWVLEEVVYDAIFGAAAVGPLLASTTGSGLTALPWNAAWDAEVQSEAAEALEAYDPPTEAEMNARTLASASYATAAALATLQSATTALQAAVAALHNFDPSTQTVEANVKQVNDVNLQGDGTVGDPWRPE